jgi:hypothetical protein
MNDNGRTSVLAEHWYQIMNQDLEWTDDNMQRTFRGHVNYRGEPNALTRARSITQGS